MLHSLTVRRAPVSAAVHASATPWGWPQRVGAALVLAAGLAAASADAATSQPQYEPFGSGDAPAWSWPGRADKPTATAPATSPAPTQGPASRSDSGPCADCGVVESVKKIERGGLAGSLPANLPNGVGTMAGGVLGAVVGRAFGDSSSAKNIGTVIGAAGGALLGHQLEKYLRQPRYEVVVRLPDGQTRTLEQSAEVAVGQAVVIANGEAKPRVRGAVQPGPAPQPDERRAQQPRPADAESGAAPAPAPAAAPRGVLNT